MFKEELLSIVASYTELQLNVYIRELETRIEDTHSLLKELKSLKKRKFSKKSLDNGARGGLG
jgi:hypothetical protein